MIVNYPNNPLSICTTESGNYKVYVMGQADGHIMNWRGCNYKFVPITRQPFRGFKTEDEAIECMKKVTADKEALAEEVKRARSMTGQHIPDERFVS